MLARVLAAVALGALLALPASAAEPVDYVARSLDKTVVVGPRGAVTLPGQPGQGTRFIYVHPPAGRKQSPDKSPGRSEKRRRR